MNPINKQFPISNIDPFAVEMVILNAKLQTVINILKEAKLTTDVEIQKGVEIGLKAFFDKFDEMTKELLQPKKNGAIEAFDLSKLTGNGGDKVH